MATAIQAELLSKRYPIGEPEGVITHLRRLVDHREREWNWALRELSFKIDDGESVAVVGRNGAGKSTLLKLLSRITEPTAGHADVRGRVGSLLEIGTGFHPQLTGRENVFLNGAILGMRRSEVARKFDEIVEFSGVGKHIDTPVKWYSSGMYIRLGFAVAAYLEPDILVVDEVLAVGDAEFQKRCLGRMNEATAEGRTVLFVSHNSQAVLRLCKRALLLERGRLVDDGPAEGVVRRYLAAVSSGELGVRRWNDPASRPGDESCRIVEVRVTDDSGAAEMPLLSSRPIVVTFEFDLTEVASSFSPAFSLHAPDGSTVFSSAATEVAESERPRLVEGRNSLRCVIPAGLLNSGRYSISLRFAMHMTRFVAYEDNIVEFDVVADHGESLFLASQDRAGVIAPILPWAAVQPTSKADEALRQSTQVSASA